MNAARSLPRAIGALALAGVLTLSACTGSTGGGDSGKYFSFSRATSLGKLIPAPQRKPAKNFSGELVGGGSTSLAKFKGKPTVINFFGSWCGPCQVETPQLAALSKRETKVNFLGVDLMDQMSAIKPFLAQKNVQYPVVFDQQTRVPLVLDVPSKAVPFTVLVDRSGQVAAVYIGVLTAKDLERPLAELSAQR